MKTLLLSLFLTLTNIMAQGVELSPNLQIHPGSINAVTIGKEIAIYAKARKEVRHLFVTHARRDAFVRPSKDEPTRITAPASEKDFFLNPESFWSSFVTERFHDYKPQTTRILAEPLAVDQWVSEGDVFKLGEYSFQVMATPGYTPGAVSYFATIDGNRIGFTGDTILGDGQIRDLYSFQDSIPEADIRGYHGYGSRLAALVESLAKLKKEKPDLLIPVRGPVIKDPAAAIDRLTDRVKRLYRNYLSTNALHWYFKEERMRLCGQRILGPKATIDLMPYAVHIDTPDWIFQKSTSRLLISDDGHGFLLDCGNRHVIEAIQDLMKKRLVKKIDGLFVTHFHDDHADEVQTAAETFGCPVYALSEYKDVLENPAAYRLPAMTDNPIANVVEKKDGETMKWKEFEFTFHFYPGQAYYHGGLFVRKPGTEPVFFIGDSFAPSGIDDYCVQNRNLVHEDTGYGLCFRKLRAIKEDYWLVNEHIPHLFRFSDKELTYLETRYRSRTKILAELFPWDDPNYGIDEQWAVFYPYGATAAPDREQSFEIRLTNHSPVDRLFHITPRGWNGAEVLSKPLDLQLKSRTEGSVRVRVKAPSTRGTCLITADVVSEGMACPEILEALIEVR
ncbi:MAG: MBL fold metallo-hydrolase [Verrucomicrobiota bacterium]